MVPVSWTQSYDLLTSRWTSECYYFSSPDHEPHSYRLKLQALDKQAQSPSERRTVASTRTQIHNRVNKCNTVMSKALGSEPDPDELEEICLRKLMAEDEWDDVSDPPRHRRGGAALRMGAEFRPVDLPSARGAAWRSPVVRGDRPDDSPLRKRAMDIELRLLLARMDQILGESRTRLVAQANTYLQQIRSRGGSENRGYQLASKAYEDVQAQGKAVRVLAQVYNACRAKMLRLAYDLSPSGEARAQDLRKRYRELVSDDLRCSTATYSTRGNTSDKFKLPWFWRMVPANLDETEEEARARDEEFVAECMFSPCMQAQEATHRESTVFRIRWINAKCALTRCTEELTILRFEMQMCYLGYQTRAKQWQRRLNRMRYSAAHRYLAQEYSSHWTDLSKYAKQRFNMCYKNVIHAQLKTN